MTKQYDVAIANMMTRHMMFFLATHEEIKTWLLRLHWN